MSAYTVSIDRSSKRYAVFLGFEIYRDFTPYEDEDKAKVEAWDHIKRLDPEASSVEYVYPVVNKITYTKRKVRK